ncbi:uncharacterized protein LKV04_017175 [Tautogolabrus adspersus]
MEKKQVITDTDCGIDDAQAIMMALAAPNIQIVGITCVFGNAEVENKDPQWEEKIQREHAVNAMIRLVTENQKQVSLVALGPLSNLALAVRLDPSLPQKLIMGGNMEATDNETFIRYYFLWNRFDGSEQ